LALNLGFSGIGVAPAGPVPKIAKENYLGCISKGRFGKMTYMTRYLEQRLDIRHSGIMAQATAVIAAALPYGSGTEDAGIWRYVSAHARGRDYHETVGRRLEAIAEEITERFPGSRHRVFVDSSPVMERTWALLAGIGHLGKNGQIIIPSQGSRVVLGEIICSSTPVPSPIEPEPPFSLCEGCNACIDSCPTGALAAPSVVDSARCLSYWTIENRDEAVPPEIAEKLTLVFGCDICTSVCPHDRSDARSLLEPPAFSCARDFDLDDIAKEDDETLSKLIKGTPLERTGPNAIRRNARLALENRKKRD
jgi:epoxyqueuosine reductase